MTREVLDCVAMARCSIGAAPGELSLDCALVERPVGFLFKCIVCLDVFLLSVL